MTKRPNFKASPLVIGGAFFLAGVALTLLWDSFPRLSPPAHEPSVAYNKTSGAFNSDAKGWQSLEQLPNSHQPAQRGSLSRDNLLIAIPSSLARLPLVEASRAWRQGTRSVVVVESNASVEAAPQHFKAHALSPAYIARHPCTHPPAHLPINYHLLSGLSPVKPNDGMAVAREQFAIYPDLEEGPPAWHKPGDARAAMAPFLANQSSGADSYKWMLYGDDDTVFYVDNVVRMLEALDPTMPYFITDHIWFRRSLTEELEDNRMHPARSAPRCLPCNYTDPLQDEPTNNEFEAPMGCPCTREFLCAHDNLKVFGGADQCNVKQHSWYFGHGGAGAILSSGLFKLASFETVETYVEAAMQGDPSKTVMSGDGVFSQVLFNVMGIMPTDPGYGYYRPHIQMFDPAWREDDTIGSKGKQPMAIIKRFELALHDWCTEECEDLLQHLITVHLGSRDAASDVNFADMLPAMQSAAGNDHLKAAAFMHQRFAGLFEQYSIAQTPQFGQTPWFSVAFPRQRGI